MPPRRQMPKEANKLPSVSWLFRYPNIWRHGAKYPKNCGWCATEFIIFRQRWRACPKCDAPSPEKKR